MGQSTGPRLGRDLEFGDTCRCVHQVVRDANNVENAVTDLLTLGKQALAVDNVHVTQIEEETDYWEALEAIDGGEELVMPGETLDLSLTYCRHVVNQGETIAVSNAREQGWVDDPAYQQHGLETYIGVPISPENGAVGTVCFVDTDSSDNAVSDSEKEFIEYLSFEVARLLEHRALSNQFERRDQLSEVLRRILRHNLRNELTLMIGHSDHLAEQASNHLQPSVLALQGVGERLASLAEKNREIDHILTSLEEREEINIREMLLAIQQEVETTHSDANCTVSAPDAPVSLSRATKRGIFELVDNAARHPDGSVMIEITARTIDGELRAAILDDGPGIPSSEAQIFDGIRETAVDHGSGIGLWIAYWIFTSQNGSLTLHDSSEKTHVEARIPMTTAIFDELSTGSPVTD